MPDRMKKSTIQANLPLELNEMIRKLALHVADVDLDGDGRDVDQAHVTIRWGLDEENIEGLKKACVPFLPFVATLGKTKIFPPSPSSKGASVIYVDVIQPVFGKMNEAVAKEVKHTPSPFDYSPHVTVCYVKPAQASKYEGLTGVAGLWWVVREVVFSNRDKEKTIIK